MGCIQSTMTEFKITYELPNSSRKKYAISVTASNIFEAIRKFRKANRLADIKSAKKA